MEKRNKAINLVGDNIIYIDTIAHIKVLNIIAIIALSSVLPGKIKAKKVIPKYEMIKPPKIEHKVLTNPIFFPFFSAVDSFL
ncbi:MAG: hypothetical protein HRT42_02165 [Campylobacteraceae bacterium]|nr:hypothetical protein [Campylobacteraceae bacterium]